MYMYMCTCISYRVVTLLVGGDTCAAIGTYGAAERGVQTATARAQWAEAHLEHSKLEEILPHRQECQELKLEHDAGKSQVKNVLQQHVAALKDMKGVVESAQRETLLSRKLWNAALAVKKRGTGLNYEGMQRGGKKM